jgi:hypothetical protein
MLSVSLISSPRVNTPLLSAVVLSICQALAMGLGYTVKINDTIDGKYFNINNRRSIFLSDIVDTDGNSIDFSGIRCTHIN